MRGLALVALLLVGALALSGCSSKGDSSTSTTGTKTGGVGTNSTATKTNTTTQAPNIPPVLMLKVTANGTASNVTMVGGSLTFSAEGSMDPDSDGLSAIAIVVQDSNRTFAPGVLYAAGKFTPVTYKFDRPGVVNVTVSGIDVRGDLTTLKSNVYVDESFSLLSKQLDVPGGVAADATDCKGPSGNPIVDAFTYDLKPFSVQKGVQYIVATYASGKGTFAICDPAGKAVSGEGTSTTPAETTGPLAAPVGLETYNVGFVVDPSAPHTAIGVTVVVHYEPKAAAAAAA